MKLLVTSLFVTSLSLTLFASEGKELYFEANCQKCHGGTEKYDPKKSKAKSLKDLKVWVSNCATHFNISWFPEEQQSVVKYLNETHYNF
jgi:hypothetical protein